MRLTFGKYQIWLLLAFCFVLTNYIGVACSQSSGPSTASKPIAPSEAAFCSTVQSYPAATGLQVTGDAIFKVRQSTAVGLGGEDAGRPIRFAEIQVVDSSGAVVQCGETDTNGAFSLTVPRGKNLTLKVNSRAQSNGHVYASILESPNTNTFYSLPVSFSTSVGAGVTTLPVGTLTASAVTGSIPGGAFNILNNILRANEALRFNICGGVDTTCTKFSVAPKVTGYWKMGVNPYVYFGGSPESGVSFYIPGTSALYILGGINGDVNSSDTDHFDDAVISHEYGHFIEDIFADTNSPGGSHDGNHIFDARLTWSEGWANFFSSFVRGNLFYRDSYGNSSGVTGNFFNYNLETNSPPLDPTTGNATMTAGEGNFREFAVARALWDGIDPLPQPGGGTVGSAGGGTDDNITDTNSAVSFVLYWDSFNGALSQATAHFRNVGLFWENVNDAALKASSVLSTQRMSPDRRDYAKPFPTTTGMGCSGTSITITPNDPASCSIGGQTVCSQGNLHVCCSNQLASNDFYDVNYDGSITSITLNRTSGTGEVDLYLYRENYTFGNQSDIVRMDISSNYPKTINLSNLPLGHYLLNVNVYTGAGNPGAQQYQLFVNGMTQVCP